MAHDVKARLRMDTLRRAEGLVEQGPRGVLRTATKYHHTVSPRSIVAQRGNDRSALSAPFGIFEAAGRLPRSSLPLDWSGLYASSRLARVHLALCPRP